MSVIESAMKWGGVLLVFGSILIAMWLMVSDPSSPLMRNWSRYCVFLERKLRLMFIWTPGAHIAAGQVGGVILSILLFVSGLETDYWWLLAILSVAGPPYYIEYMRKQRIEKIEEQLDGFLMALANSLKATPSISNAFQSVTVLLPKPFKEEVELANKEMRVGSTLDQALLSMAGRIGSKQVDAALSAILIGRQLGGDLPHILEITGQNLREMARLEGVVRSKTAEGKAQLFVLVFFPFVMVYMLQQMMPGYFEQLTDNVVGWVIAIAAGMLWVSAIVVARKVLAVDI